MFTIDWFYTSHLRQYIMMNNRFKNGQRIPEWKKPPFTTSVSSTAIMNYPSGKNNFTDSHISTTETIGFPTLSMTLPILTSHCPGWVCYAEKSAPEAIPYLSSVKSPQQIVGSVIKSVLSNPSEMTDLTKFLDGLTLRNISLDNQSTSSGSTTSKQKVYVVSIQPCYDKKLEASRKVMYSLFFRIFYKSFLFNCFVSFFHLVGFLSFRERYPRSGFSVVHY